MKIKNLIIGLAAGAILCFCGAGVAIAQSYNIDWSVTYTDQNKQVIDDYDQDAIDKRLSEMQPGDDVSFDITIINKNEKSTDWYILNEVIKTLEDNDLEYGGAYTYSLSYNDDVLYSSDTVGGEGEGGEQGLKEATEATDEWLYLTTLQPGEEGLVKLEVGLDGSTQGNAYENKLGTLRIQLSTEITPDTTDVPRNPRQPVSASTNGVPRTSDILAGCFALLALAAGAVFFTMALRRLRHSGKEGR